MPWRFIGIILVFIVFLVFIGFNLENKCDVNFWFDNGLKDVPVFYTIFVSFTLGVLVTLPVVLGGRKKRVVGSPSATLAHSAGDGEKKDEKPKTDAAIAQEFDESPPSYSGGKYFDKNKKKK